MCVAQALYGKMVAEWSEHERDELSVLSLNPGRI